MEIYSHPLFAKRFRKKKIREINASITLFNYELFSRNIFQQGKISHFSTQKFTLILSWQNFVKTTLFTKELLNSWFDEIIFWSEKLIHFSTLWIDMKTGKEKIFVWKHLMKTRNTFQSYQIKCFAKRIFSSVQWHISLLPLILHKSLCT